MAISKRLRFEILRRDNHTCQSCGRTPPDVKLTIDHVIPVALGGRDEASNLVTACADCNAGKSSSSPDATVVEAVATDAIRWSAAITQAAAEMQLHDHSGVYEAVVNAWTNYRRREIPTDYRETIDQFLAAGLPADDIVQMAHVADAKPSVYNRWSYFCGCCWTRIRKLQERASEIVAAAEPAGDQLPNITIQTQWTQEEIEVFLMSGGYECEDHNAGKCASDLLCRLVGAARLYEAQLIQATRDWKSALRDERVMAAAESEEYANG